MKKFLVLVTLLMGCTTSYNWKVGECLCLTDRNEFKTVKVISVGRTSIKVQLTNGTEGTIYKTHYNELERTDCFDLFDEKKEK